jgi:nitrate/TMAO reductase-like tetraheme cytochrome c subunit
MSQTSAVFLSLIVCTLLGAGTQPFGPGREDPQWELGKPAPAIPLSPAKVEGLDKYACASCHREVAEEWAETAHAISWLDEHYRKQMEHHRRPESCHGCHAPEPMHLTDVTERPDVRENERDLGISCESCHLGPENTMLGPRGTPTDAHPSKQSETMTGLGSSAVCITCHKVNIGPVIGIAKDFESSKQAERGRSCVGCHMAQVERRWATAKEGAEQPPLRTGRSHAIQTPRDPTFLRRAFELSVRTEGKTTFVTLANQAGHRVPGLVGRSIEFEARVLGANGEELGRGTLTLDERSYLPVDGKLEIEVAAAGAEVSVVGKHHDPRVSEPVMFLEERLKAR